jgi:hypothetical protein
VILIIVFLVLSSGGLQWQGRKPLTGPVGELKSIRIDVVNPKTGAVEKLKYPYELKGAPLLANIVGEFAKLEASSAGGPKYTAPSLHSFVITAYRTDGFTKYYIKLLEDGPGYDDGFYYFASPGSTGVRMPLSLVTALTVDQIDLYRQETLHPKTLPSSEPLKLKDMVKNKEILNLIRNRFPGAENSNGEFREGKKYALAVVPADGGLKRLIFVKQQGKWSLTLVLSRKDYRNESLFGYLTKRYYDFPPGLVPDIDPTY